MCCTLQFRHLGWELPERGEGEREERTTEQSAGEEGGGGENWWFILFYFILLEDFFNSSGFRGSSPLGPLHPTLVFFFLWFTEVPFCSPGSTPAESAAALP